MTQEQWEAIIKSREDKLLADFGNEIKKRDQLITELCDVLINRIPFVPDESSLKDWELLQRGREATR